MSAEIETMAYSGKLPWHGLGEQVDPNLEPLEMMEKSGTNWSVKLVPAYASYNGKKIAVNHSALIRESDAKVLDVVGEDWNPVQNKEAFEFFTDFVKNGNMEMHTAGSLQGGRMVWALAKVTDQAFELFGGDKIESYLLFSNPFKYGYSIDIRFTPIRVVCWNTLTLSLSQKENQMVRLTHAHKFDAKEVKNLLGVAAMKLEKYREMAQILGSHKYTMPKVTEYFNDIFPVITQKETSVKEVSLNAKRALDMLDKQPGSKYASGTWWQAANVITYITDHLMGRSADARLTSAWYGANKSLKLNAMKRAMEYAQA